MLKINWGTTYLNYYKTIDIGKGISRDLKKKKIFLLHLNEFNLKDGFENYLVAKIFYAPSNDKKVWEKKYIYTIQYAILIIFAALFQN